MADQSFGQKAVGLSFNPAGNPEVNNLKELAAAFIDACNDARNLSGDGEVKRMYSVAITEAQTAQMWAVKAATWNLPKATGSAQTASGSTPSQASPPENTKSSPEDGSSNQQDQAGAGDSESNTDASSPVTSSTDATGGQPNIGSEASA